MTPALHRHPRQARPWRVRYLDHGGAEQQRAFTRRADAERFLDQLRSATGQRPEAGSS